MVDIGGTTTDIGSLNGGFPRQTSSIVSKAGLDLNCTMPDVLSIRLGGGSVVCPKPLTNSVSTYHKFVPQHCQGIIRDTNSGKCIVLEEKNTIFGYKFLIRLVVCLSFE